MAEKSLMVLGESGSGKKTLIGSLIHKCGVELDQLERLETNGVQNYAEIVLFYERNGIPQSFYAPSGKIVIHQRTIPDFVFWVVDAKSVDQGKASSDNLAAKLSAGLLQYNEKLIVIISKMDLVNWSEVAFEAIANNFSALVSQASNVSIVPISASEGDNLLDSPKSSSWIPGTHVLNGKGVEVSLDQPLMRML